MSEESSWALVDKSRFTTTERKKFYELREKLLNDYKYRVEFLKNPQSFVEAKTGIKVDDSLMKRVWESVRKLTDDEGQPKLGDREGKLRGIILD
jgi:hypothetical protein